MNNINKILAVLVIIVIAVGAYFYFNSKKVSAPTNENNQETNNQMTNPQPTPVPETQVPESKIATVETSLGSFEVTLNAKAAPKTVANFIKLSTEGFYNGLIFHRIVKEEGFHLIQGGDPKGDGTGGPGYTIPAEIGLKHTKGAIATARLSDQVNPNKESSGSQFYIVEEDIPFLDDNYTVFGYVTKGMDVVDKIGQVETNPANDMPVTKVTINKITIK